MYVRYFKAVPVNILANNITDDPNWISTTTYAGPFNASNPSLEYRVVTLKSQMLNVSVYTQT